MRFLRALAVLTGVLLIAGLFLFPTDDLVRQGLARVTRPGGPELVFRRAVLRPWGLRLDEVALRNPDGTALATANWIRVRPSLWGFLHRDYFGRPWAVFAGFCRGTIEGTVDARPAGLAVTATWSDLDMGDCPLLTRTDFKLTGRTDGTASVRLGGAAQPAGEGRLVLHDTSLHGGPRQSLLGGLESVTADSASVRWQLASALLTFDALDWHGPEFEAVGDGRVRVAGSVEKSELDLRLKVVAGPHPPPLIQRALAALPPAPDDPVARSLVVKGTVGRPEAVMR